MKKSRMIAALVMVMLAASLFAGCSGGGNASAPAATEAAAAAETAVEEAAAVAETAAEEAATVAETAAEEAAAVAETAAEEAAEAVETVAEEEAPVATAGKANSVKLTVEDAKKVAFDDAGVKEKDVVLKKAGLTTDDGITKYEVEFYYKDTEYEYDIDPNSGKITDLDKDPMDAEDKAKMEALKKNASGKTSGKDGKITVDDAKEIAFADAGVKEKDVVLKKAELGEDDGVKEYEIEFYYKDTEYSYDIEPKTGIITDLDLDPMDAEDRAEMEALKKKASDKSSGKSGNIDEAKALEIALKQAGVSKSDIYDKKAKLDFDDDFGKEIFEVEFKVGSTEYEYKIDPKTGDIIVEKIETDD